MRIKRILVLVLAFMLVFSNSAYAAGALNVMPKEEILNKKPVNKEDRISKEELDEMYKSSDKVRVIIEAEGEPAITYATKKGVKFTDLSQSKQAELQNKAFTKQDQIKQNLSQNKIDMKFEQSFATVFNGFSGIVEYGKIELIEKLPGVANVTISTEYERPDVTPDMKYSKELVEAQRTWDHYGYDGKGMIVGVIDSGVDPSHKDFILTDEESAMLSEEDVNAYISNENLPGQYHTPKVPYGYNYMDENQEVRDLGPEASMHGMHVAGTVGSNGDEDNGGLKGVAPEAQILALKVFGNDPDMGSTWGDIYIKAIDDSIILGADVLNMSLGSVAAFVDSDNAEQQAIKNAVEHGILMSISAGNSGHLGNGFFNPYTANPDIGVVGAPGVSYDSLQVASIENSHIGMDAITYSFGDVEDNLAFLSQGNVHPEANGVVYELEYAKLGGEEDFEGKDLTGKFALVQRGEHAFTDKALNAQAAGAEGVIIYNNEDGILNMATDSAIVIPQLFMFKSDGDMLAELLKEDVEVTIEFKGEEVISSNPEADQMSDFTSWGLTPNLDFKPEITAPGGNILSTFQNNQYGMMSGTSMAAPHVAGGAALVLQKVDEKFDLQGKDRVNMAKNILMNTSSPVLDKGALNEARGEGIPYSPRRQGSGLMKLHAAIGTPVVVSETTTNEAKVALREVGDQFTFSLSATNFSDAEVAYDLSANVQTDLQIFGLLGNAHYTGSLDELEAVDMIADVTINNNETNITIAAGETVTFDVKVDLTDAEVFSFNDSGQSGYLNPDEVFPNGYFVEGFVKLTDPADNNPELSVPYVGFKGDWNAPPVLDELAYDGNDSFYEDAGMLYPGEEEGSYIYLGHDPFTGQRSTSNIAISPNTNSAQDKLVPILSYLRNAKLVEYNVLDEDGEQLRKIKTEKNIRKNYFDGGRGAPYRLTSSVFWDGTIKGQTAPDGQYFFEIKTTIDYPGAEAQSLKVPVIVDTVAPELEAEIEGSKVIFEASDEGSGVRHLELIVDGESLGLAPPTATEFDFEGEIPAGTVITLVAVDYAGNATEVNFGGINDNEGPVIYVDTPETFTIHDTSEVQVAGKVTDKSEVVEFKIQGEDVELVWDKDQGHYTFDAVVTFEDGANPINIYAKDIAGNETSLSKSRTIFVDTTAPVIELGDVSTIVSNDTDSFELVATLSDNAEELRFLINDDEVFYNDFPGFEMIPFSTEVTTKLDLELGENVFNLELIDMAGNMTTEEITITREQISRVSGETRYETAVEISQSGWETADTVVLARGDNHADALAGVPLAEKHDAPLLLTRTSNLSEVTKDEILRLGTETVYILGGTSAISDNVVQELADEGIDVKRINGKTRDETAVAIAKEVVGEGTVDKAIIVNWNDFPDALSVASYAAKEGMPILLSKTNSIPQATQDALDELGITDTIVIGGTTAISDEVFNSLPNAQRISGSTRYETSIEVAKHFNVETNKYFVATGKDFADALAGAALAAKEGTGILLVKDSVTEELEEFIVGSNLDTLTILGGTVAVNPKLADDLAKLLK